MLLIIKDFSDGKNRKISVKTEQAQTLMNAYQLLEANELKVYRLRMDAGSYAKDIIEVAAVHSELFYIRAHRCESLTERMRQIAKWETAQTWFPKLPSHRAFISRLI